MGDPLDLDFPRDPRRARETDDEEDEVLNMAKKDPEDTDILGLGELASFFGWSDDEKAEPKAAEPDEDEDDEDEPKKKKKAPEPEKKKKAPEPEKKKKAPEPEKKAPEPEGDDGQGDEKKGDEKKGGDA